jgi:tRNA G18 (ribose-2'-O)-methylase SpoU
MSPSAYVNVRSFLLGAGVSLAAVFLVQRHRSRTLGRRATKATCSPSSADENKQKTSNNVIDSPDLDLRLIRKAQAVILNRTSCVTIVIERCTNDHNYSAILRTAEALGIQHVWIIDPPLMTDGAGNVLDENIQEESGGQGIYTNSTQQQRAKILRLTKEEIEQRQHHRLFAQNATEWLTIREFQTTAECIAACRESGLSVWVTDLSQEAVPLTSQDLEESGYWPLPRKLAIVMGTEAVGCSQEMLESADLRVYLPLRGFADSLNLSVATALIIHHVFLLEPSYVGQMDEEERTGLRKAWFSKLARQRLLGSRDKKTRRKLLTMIRESETLQVKQGEGHTLNSDQLQKISKLPEYHESLKLLEETANYSSTAVDQAVADLVRSPPQPLSDLRRADLHRVSFVGKNVKNMNGEHWKDMPAVAKGGITEPMSTALYFRERVVALVGEK